MTSTPESFDAQALISDVDADGSPVMTPAARALTPAPWGMGRASMIDLPYTSAALPEIESDVRALLEQITSAVVAELQPAAILLCGSLARGEGGAYRVGRETRLTTDVELLAVYAGRNEMLRAWRARRRTAALRETLAESLAVPQLSLATVPAALLRNPPPSLTSFEMLRSSRVLYGSAELARPSTLPLERVSPENMMQRLVKSGNALLVAWSWLTGSDAILSDGAARAVGAGIDAVFLACGDTWLFRTRHYDTRLAVRAEWLRLPFAPGPGLSERLRDEYQVAVRERLFPSARNNASRAEQLVRWEHAAIEWIGCYRATRQWAWWGRYGLRVVREGWHPIRRAMGNMAEAAHTGTDGGIPVATQRKVLPLLIEWALEGWEDPARRDRVASMLHLRREESRDLTYLVVKFLSAMKLIHDTPARPPVPLTPYTQSVGRTPERLPAPHATVAP